ncbi:hypothetical protein [Methanosphaera cuniculi]|uniref:hypothetical protein n=1 Tax=Methanosphaera cuniculi TaxID=1077256 RepID=UPI0026DBD4A5|nr:hypothetical protein [Methanosphaera cuniculi]
MLENNIESASMIGISLFILLLCFYITSRNLILMSPIIIYIIIIYFIKSDELNTKISINSTNHGKYYVQFSNPIILSIILVLIFCTYHILNNYSLTGLILIAYIIVYIYEIILVTLCLSPKEIEKIASKKRYNINKPEDFKKFQIFLIIISCIPPFILLII